MENIIVPVLELNDDNHSPCYVTQGGYWYDAESFMTDVLCKPHTVEFKIKNIIYVDLNEKLNYEGMDAFALFCLLDHRPDWENMTQEQIERRQKAFDFFWYTDEEVLYASQV